jgi:hypothetical protein
MPIMSAIAMAVAVVVETVRLSGTAGSAAGVDPGADDVMKKPVKRKGLARELSRRFALRKREAR